MLCDAAPAAPAPAAPAAAPGTVVALADAKITVACADGAMALLTVLPEGKKRMSAADFINGRKINVGDVLI